MFSLGDSHIYYLSRTATDMRKGFDSLSGEVFIFYNSSRTRLKLLHWERGGFVIYHKRFEQGILSLPEFDSERGGYMLSWRELMLMVEGVSLRRIRLRKRFDVPPKNSVNHSVNSCYSAW